MVVQMDGTLGSDGPELSDAAVGPGPEASRRVVERAVVSYLGIAIQKGDQFAQVNLVDLSAEGARLVADADFDPQREFVLKVPETGAAFVSEVVWKDKQTYGIRFLRPSKD